MTGACAAGDGGERASAPVAGGHDSGAAARAPVSLAEQIEEVGRAIRERERTYPDRIHAGRLRPETAQRKLDHLRAAYRTLEWLALNHDWIRREAALRRAEERARAQRELDLMDADGWPETAAAREVFGDAEIVGIRPLEGP